LILGGDRVGFGRLRAEIHGAIEQSQGTMTLLSVVKYSVPASRGYWKINLSAPVSCLKALGVHEAQVVAAEIGAEQGRPFVEAEGGSPWQFPLVGHLLRAHILPFVAGGAHQATGANGIFVGEPEAGFVDHQLVGGRGKNALADVGKQIRIVLREGALAPFFAFGQFAPPHLDGSPIVVNEGEMEGVV